ncbi:hypothetical protein FANTH_8832 [Fusarium anthophilum]|uniref:Uncharacterized protein n=1 Tax=Fusarium anthophilum TaxID=48485 RepID=A0A8H4ZA03_9HYPO|nr:hypothetical protein FANTH_8832 [Fusarium anthophilum]
MATCAATYTECLGYSPLKGEGSLSHPSAYSITPITTKPSTAPSYSPPAITGPIGAHPSVTTPTQIITTGTTQVIPTGIVTIINTLTIL